MDAEWPEPWDCVGRKLKKAIGADLLMKAGFKIAKKALKQPAHTKAR